MPVFEWRSTMPVSAEELYAYHARPGAFERLAPPWHKLRVVEQDGGMSDGARLVFEYGLGPVKRRWAAEMTGHVAGSQFIDRQVQGPFARWEHTHRFLPIDEHSSELLDHVEYGLPAGKVTDAVGAGPASSVLRRLFAFRHQRTLSDLRRHAVWAGQPRLTVAIAGASGLIGSNLAVYLTTAGHRVIRLVRHAAQGPDEVQWDPAGAQLDADDLADVDAIVNFSGENLFGIWTTGKRQAILTSRVQATGAIARALAKAQEVRPRTLLSVSAVGAYGSRGGEALTEESARGDDFLADVCAAWEKAADPAAAAGVRVVHPRFGLVMTPQGGALGTMLPVFKAALGGRIGDGWQWWSWVAIDDLLAALEWALHDGSLAGPVNVTSPEPVTNREFTDTLAHVLRRPAVLAAPQLLVERGAGDLGRQMLLASQRALPLRLKEASFTFDHPRLEEALRFLLGRE
jgi:uncharacterized protein